MIALCISGFTHLKAQCRLQANTDASPCQLYPINNPVAEGELNLLGDQQGEVSWQIHDCTGRQMAAGQLNEATRVLSVKTLPPEPASPLGFHRFLLTPEGVQYKGLQERDIISRYSSFGSFSKDGTKFCQDDWPPSVKVYDFDRGRGVFSNPQKWNRLSESGKLVIRH